MEEESVKAALRTRVIRAEVEVEVDAPTPEGIRAAMREALAAVKEVCPELLARMDLQDVVSTARGSAQDVETVEQDKGNGRRAA
jgi:hypothetical protein